MAGHEENVSKRFLGANEQFRLTYWNRYSHKFPPLQSSASVGDEVPQKDTDGHGQEYPYREESVQQS